MGESWDLGSRAESDAGCQQRASELGGSSAGRWTAPGNDLVFIWSDNGDICDLPWFVAGSQEPYTPLRCWGLRQRHQQTKMKVVQSAGCQGEPHTWAGPTGPPQSQLSPLSTARWPGPAQSCKSLCLTQPQVKSLSSLFLHRLDLSKLPSEHQSTGKGHNPAPPLSPSRRGKWGKVKCIDWTLEEWIHLANNKAI